MDRAEKRELVTGLNEAFKSAGSVVVAHYAGITVAQMNDLRSKMRRLRHRQSREEPSRQIAFQGTEPERMSEPVHGTDLDCLREDPVTRQKSHPISPRRMTGWSFSAARWERRALKADGVKALATMPSLDELRAGSSA